MSDSLNRNCQLGRRLKFTKSIATVLVVLIHINIKIKEYLYILYLYEFNLK